MFVSCKQLGFLLALIAVWNCAASAEAGFVGADRLSSFDVERVESSSADSSTPVNSPSQHPAPVDLFQLVERMMEQGAAPEGMSSVNNSTTSYGPTAMFADVVPLQPPQVDTCLTTTDDPLSPYTLIARVFRPPRS